MTKEYNLELYRGVYALKGQREQKGQGVVDYWKSLLCVDFVALVMGSGPSENIKVIVSDEAGGKGAVEVGVRRQGYYRWFWRFKDAGLVAKNTSSGLYRHGEEILMSMYPNDFADTQKGKEAVFLQERAADEEHTLWIRILNL